MRSIYRLCWGTLMLVQPPGRARKEESFNQIRATSGSNCSGSLEFCLPLKQIQGNLSFMCPEEYRSGTSGGLRFDPLCECADLC